MIINIYPTFTVADKKRPNTFLGFFLNLGVNPPKEMELFAKKNQGVIWGKSADYLRRHGDLLKQLAEFVELHSTCRTPVVRHPNIKWHGPLSTKEWKALLKESKFLIGLGDPLLGPSAIDAISAGAVYINPIYKVKEKKLGGGKVRHYNSQHPYAETIIGSPSVCNYNEDSTVEALSCVKYALTTDIAPFIPRDFTLEAHIARVKDIFNL